MNKDAYRRVGYVSVDSASEDSDVIEWARPDMSELYRPKSRSQVNREMALERLRSRQAARAAAIRRNEMRRAAALARQREKSNERRMSEFYANRWKGPVRGMTPHTQYVVSQPLSLPDWVREGIQRDEAIAEEELRIDNRRNKRIREEMEARVASDSEDYVTEEWVDENGDINFRTYKKPKN
jgi:hypothetical protein